MTQSIEETGFSIFNYALMFWGGSVCLALQYMLQAIFVFSKKSSHMFILIISGLAICLIEISVVTLFLYVYDEDEAVGLGIVVALFWFAMIQITTILYVKRIQSLGFFTSFDKYLKYLPYAVGVLEIPTVVSIILDGLNLDYFSYYDFSSISFASLSIILEVVLYLSLNRKLEFILEYKPAALKKIAFNIRIMFVLTILLEVGIIASKVMKCNLDFSIRPFTHILRIFVLIQFYNDLLVSVNRDMQNHLSLKIPSYLADSCYAEEL
eukprot:NODE_7_length_67686_cov_1.621421.p26 type:complete len:266 gc:universal NODE_7_length_67686_cov_1.621421:35231-36028(+)